MSAPLRAKKRNNTIVWALMGLLIISLTGFGVQSVGSGGRQAVATVGDQKVTVDTYVRALNTQLRALSQQIGTNVSFEQARIFGIDRQVLEAVLATAALDAENARLGLSVGDTHVRDALLGTEAFQDLSGNFDQTTYEFALSEANLKPGEYDEILRNDTARTLLQAAVGGGIDAGKAYPLAIMSYVGETRDFEWAFLDAAYLLDPLGAPSDQDLMDHYNANPASYTTPEARQITYAWITPEMMIPNIEVDADALRALYDAETARFNQPDRRIVERVVFPDIAAAQAALDAISSGEKTFEQVVEERGLALADVDLGEVEESDLSDAAGAAIFLMNEPGLAGPLDSTFGPALFRVNAILDAQSTSFEEAREELKIELVADRARRRIDDLINTLDDLLAGGATLEDIAAETPLVLETIAFSEGDEAGIAANEEFREVAAAAREDDFPEVHTFESGGIFSLRLDTITPAKLRPFEDVQTDVAKDWKVAETTRRILAYAEGLTAELDSGKSLGELGIAASRENGLRRDAFVDGAPGDMVTKLFALRENGSIISEEDGTIVIARLKGIHAYDSTTTQNATLLDDVAARYAQQLGGELFDAFALAIEKQEGISINQNLIGQIQNQMTSGGAR